MNTMASDRTENSESDKFDIKIFAKFSTVFLLVIATGVALALAVITQNPWAREYAARDAAATFALHDPTFLAATAKAGYRVERPLRSRREDLIARCARSDRNGPLPCDPFPTGLYPSISGDAEIVVRTIP